MFEAAQQCVATPNASFPWYGSCIMTAIIMTTVTLVVHIYTKYRIERKAAMSHSSRETE